MYSFNGLGKCIYDGQQWTLTRRTLEIEQVVESSAKIVESAAKRDAVVAWHDVVQFRKESICNAMRSAEVLRTLSGLCVGTSEAGSLNSEIARAIGAGSMRVLQRLTIVLVRCSSL